MVRKTLNRSVYVFISGLFLVMLLMVWIFATNGERIEDRIVAPLLLPSPQEVLSEFPVLHFQQGLVRSSLISLMRVTEGFLLAAVVAIPLGIAIASWKPVEALFHPLIVFSSYVPTVSFVPLTMVWFGLGEPQKVGFLFIACFIPLLFSVIKAVEAVPGSYLEVAITKGASQWELVWRVLVPVAMPEIWGGLRMTYAVGWCWIILAEVVSGDNGLGFLMTMSERRGHTAAIYAIILVIAFLGFVCDWLWKKSGTLIFPYCGKK